MMAVIKATWNYSVQYGQENLLRKTVGINYYSCAFLIKRILMLSLLFPFDSYVLKPFSPVFVCSYIFIRTLFILNLVVN